MWPETSRYPLQAQRPVPLSRLMAAQALPAEGFGGTGQPKQQGQEAGVPWASHLASRSIPWAHPSPHWVAQQAAAGSLWAGEGECPSPPRPMGPTKPHGTGRRKPSRPEALKVARQLQGAAEPSQQFLHKSGLLTLTPQEGLGCVDKRA